MIGLLLKVFQASLKVGEGAEGLSNDLGLRSALMTGAQVVQGWENKKRKKSEPNLSNMNEFGRNDFFHRIYCTKIGRLKVKFISPLL